jgi:ASC-1-like (ASCH) protein
MITLARKISDKIFNNCTSMMRNKELFLIDECTKIIENELKAIAKKLIKKADYIDFEKGVLIEDVLKILQYEKK